MLQSYTTKDSEPAIIRGFSLQGKAKTPNYIFTYQSLSRSKPQVMRPINIARCDVCDLVSDKLNDDEFWDQRVCRKHISDGTPECDACYRFLKETKYLDLTDGRKLCSDCSSIAILDPKECKPLIRNVHEFYRSLNLKMDESLRVLLVDKIAMLKFNSPDEDDLLGTVWISDRRPKRALVRISKCSKSEGSIEVERKPEFPQKLTARQRSSGKIKALIIKFGMPNMQMGATMAHEMMHAWFYLNGVTELERRVEEGICNLMGYMWMGWFCSTGADFLLCKTSDEQVQYTRKLKDCLEHVMECDEDEAYGQGFRDAMKAVSRFGLTTVLNHIVKERCLPSVHCES